METPKSWRERIDEAKTVPQVLKIKAEFEKALNEGNAVGAPYEIPAILNRIDSRIKEIDEQSA